MSFNENQLGNVLVIGGCGLLGHHIVKHLLESGSRPSEITVFDICTRHNRYSSVSYVAGSIAEKSILSAAIDRAQPNVIINVASPDAMTPDKSAFALCNVDGVRNIIELAQEKDIRVLVHTSSSEVIQNSYHDIVFATEEWPVLDNPVNGSVYAKTKAIGETMVIRANGKKGLFTTAIRLPTIFGEGDVVITKHFIEMGRSGKIRFQVGPNANLYDFIYAGNAAEGHILAAKVSPHGTAYSLEIQLGTNGEKALLKVANSTPDSQASRVDGEIFTLSNDDPWYFWDVPRFMAATAGFPIEKADVWVFNMEVACFFLAMWEWIFWVITSGRTIAVNTRMLRYTSQQRTFDITKAKKRLGYRPRVGMKEGLRRSIEAHLGRERLPDNSKTKDA